MNNSPYLLKITKVYYTDTKMFKKDIIKLEDMPSESKYYKTISEENFLAYKSDTILIFMSKI